MNLAPPCLRINGLLVVIEHVNSDYSATFAGYETGYPIGRGSDQAAALQSLLKQCDEWRLHRNEFYQGASDE